MIALMAILGGIAVFSVTSLNEDSAANSCVFERKSITTAMWAAKAESKPIGDYTGHLSGNPKYFVDGGTLAAPAWGPSSEHPGSPGCPTTITNP